MKRLLHVVTSLRLEIDLVFRISHDHIKKRWLHKQTLQCHHQEIAIDRFKERKNSVDHDFLLPVYFYWISPKS